MRAALLVSLLVHALFLSLSVGGEALGLPGLHFPWEERRAAAHELHVVLAPGPAPAAVSTSSVDPAPVIELPVREVIAAAPAPPPIAPAAPPVVTTAPAMSVVAPPKEEPSEKLVEEDVLARQEAARQEQQRQEVLRAAQAAREAAARVESEGLEPARREEQAREAARIEGARLAEQARREAAKQEQERADAARQEQARLAQLEAARLAEQAKQEAERAQAARQEQSKQEQVRQEQLRQEQLRQEQLRQEQLRQAEREAERQESARQEQARQEQARQEQAKREAAERELAQQERARKERAEQEARREERLRAIGQQLAQEAAQRDAAKLAPGASSLRRGWLFGRADPNADLIQYAQAMGRKIELNMAFDTVREVVRQPHVHPVVTVAVRADGSVEKVAFVTSSGVAAIDEAVRKVIASQAPYGAFPPALARQYDVIEIRRTWKFDVAIRLE